MEVCMDLQIAIHCPLATRISFKQGNEHDVLALKGPNQVLLPLEF